MDSPRQWLTVLAEWLLLSGLAAPCGAVTPSATAPAVPAVSAPPNPLGSGPTTGPVPVQLRIQLNLTALHPAATTGALVCGALAQTRDWVEAHRDSLTEYATFDRLVRYPSHYVGQQATLAFPITGRTYSGTQTYTVTLSAQQLTDPATHLRFAPNPTVLAACWLSLNGQPVIPDALAGLQVVNTSNVTAVRGRAVVVASGDAGPAVNLSGDLTLQGGVFTPGPVTLSASIGSAGGLPQLAGSLATTPVGVTTAAPPVASGPLQTAPTGPSVPAVAGLTVSSSSPAAHTVLWSCAPQEEGCSPAVDFGDGNAIPAGHVVWNYEVWSRDPNAAAFTQLSPPAAISVQSDCTEIDDGGACLSRGNFRQTISLTSFLVPQTVFRVIRKDPAGALAPAQKDYVDASPPQPQQPTGLTATEPAPGHVALSWQPVAGAVAYRMFEKGSNAPPARATATSMALQGIAAGSHTYQVATEYPPGYRTDNLPEATVLVHSPPTPSSVPFLSKNNGAGSAGMALLHVLANGRNANDSIGSFMDSIPLVVGYDGSGGPIYRGTSAQARYGNLTEFGLGRSVACWQWPDTLAGAAFGTSTVCLAGSHGSPPGTMPPSAGALVAAAQGAPYSYSVIYTSTGGKQFYASFAPDPTKANAGADLLQVNAYYDSNGWGWGWKISTTATFDTEGPKYTPNACLTCHGGTVNSQGVVTGASLLPIDPGLVALGGASQEPIRALNAIVAASGASPAVVSYLNGLYGGKVATPGTVAPTSYVPSAWSQQAELFQTVVKPDCLMCHLATPAARSFGTAANFIQNKALIYADVCSAHVMPNAQVPYQHFWTAQGSLGATAVSLSGYMLAILGYTSCP